MVEGNSYNKRLWGRNSQGRENCVLTISSYITILNPLPILNKLGNEIPILKSGHVSMTIDPPIMVHRVCAEFRLVQNNARAFVFNNARININSLFP